MRSSTCGEEPTGGQRQTAFREGAGGTQVQIAAIFLEIKVDSVRLAGQRDSRESHYDCRKFMLHSFCFLYSVMLFLVRLNVSISDANIGGVFPNIFVISYLNLTMCRQ